MVVLLVFNTWHRSEIINNDSGSLFDKLENICILYCYILRHWWIVCMCGCFCFCCRERLYWCCSGFWSHKKWLCQKANQSKPKHYKIMYRTFAWAEGLPAKCRATSWFLWHFSKTVSWLEIINSARLLTGGISLKTPANLEGKRSSMVHKRIEAPKKQLQCDTCGVRSSDQPNT